MGNEDFSFYLCELSSLKIVTGEFATYWNNLSQHNFFSVHKEVQDLSFAHLTKVSNKKAQHIQGMDFEIRESCITDVSFSEAETTSSDACCSFESTDLFLKICSSPKFRAQTGSSRDLASIPVRAVILKYDWENVHNSYFSCNIQEDQLVNRPFVAFICVDFILHTCRSHLKGMRLLLNW